MKQFHNKFYSIIKLFCLICSFLFLGNFKAQTVIITQPFNSSTGFSHTNTTYCNANSCTTSDNTFGFYTGIPSCLSGFTSTSFYIRDMNACGDTDASETLTLPSESVGSNNGTLTFSGLFGFDNAGINFSGTNQVTFQYRFSSLDSWTDGFTVQSTSTSAMSYTIAATSTAMIADTANTISITMGSGHSGKTLEWRLLINGFDGATENIFFDEFTISHTPLEIANASFIYETCVGKTVNFDASASSPSGGASITSYEWDFDNNGSYEVSTGSATTSNTFSTFGIYSVRMRITDSASQVDDTLHLNVVVDTIPSVAITSSSIAMCNSETRTITYTPSGGTLSVLSGPGSLLADVLTPSASGTIVLQYIYSNGAGCTDTSLQSIISIISTPIASITSSSTDLCIETASLPSSRLLTGSPSGGTFSITGGTGSGTITDNLLKATSAGTIEITYTYFSATCGGGSVTQTITAISGCQEPIIANPCETGGISLGNAIDTALANSPTNNQTILIGSNYYTNKADGGNWGLTSIALPDNLDGLTIDGQGMWVFYDAAGLGIFDLSGSRNVTFKNFTIEGVNRSNGGFNLTDVKNLTFENVNFVNSPTTQPMVISANTTDTTEVTFNNCTFSGNPTGNPIGSCNPNTGAVLIQNGSAPYQPIITTFNNCTFRCNCRDGNGGAVQIISSADLPNRTLITTTFNNCEFANNFTSAGGTQGGGAIYAQEQQTLNINSCRFYNNEVEASISGGGGGAISLFSKVDLNVFESIFSNNSTTGASSDGGAISATSGGASSINNVSIISSEFSNNSAADEGGAVWYRNTNASILNSTFISNTSGKEGAGIQIENATGTSTFNNLTITTHASNHGIFSNSAPYTLNNSRFFNNASDLGGTAPSGSGNTNAAPNASASDISSNTDCSIEIATPPLVNDSLPEPCASFESGVALPIELLSFTVKTNQQCKAEIEWKTATETNNNYFKLLKSNDGINFKEIAKVNGKGNSTEISKYTYIDKENNQDQVYYQLAQVDFDGTTEYFKIISYKNNCNNSISSIEIKPNPFYDFIHLDIANIQTGNIAIEILNIEGKILYKKSEMVSTNQFQTNIQTTHIKEGFYFIKIFNNQNQIDIIKLIKL